MNSSLSLSELQRLVRLRQKQAAKLSRMTEKLERKRDVIDRKIEASVL